jgi:hypothetical protein
VPASSLCKGLLRFGFGPERCGVPKTRKGQCLADSCLVLRLTPRGMSRDFSQRSKGKSAGFN